MCWSPKDDDYDRVEYDSDGRAFYGFDSEEANTTDWYTEDGCLDSVTRTPSDDDDWYDW